MNFSVWIDNDSLYRILEKEDYTLITCRRLLTKYFGYKSGKDIKQQLGLKESFLSCKLAYKGDIEFADLLTRFSVIIDYLKEKVNPIYVHSDPYLLLCRKNWRTGDYSFGSEYSAYRYKAQHVLDSLLRIRLREKYELNIFTGEENNEERTDFLP